MGPPDHRRRRYRQWLIATGAVVAAVCLTIFISRRPDSEPVTIPDDYEPAKTYKPTPADLPVREKLKSRIVSLDLVDVELRKAIQKLRDISSERIRVNWAALSKERVKPETTVNVRLKNVTLNKAIQTVLDDCLCIGEGRRREIRIDLGYVVEDGAITISSRAELAGHTYVRQYDIGDRKSVV